MIKCNYHGAQRLAMRRTGYASGSGEGGTVVSDVEIRFEWQTSGEFDSNHFTLQKHFRAGAGLVWKVYYGGMVRQLS